MADELIEEEERVEKVDSLLLKKTVVETRANECQTIYTVRPHILLDGNPAHVLKNMSIQTAVTIGIDEPNTDLLEKIKVESVLQECAWKLETGEDELTDYGEGIPENFGTTESATTQTLTSERSSSGASYFSDTALRETLHFSLNKLTTELEQLKDMYGKVTEIINAREAANEKRYIRMENELIKYRNEMSLAKLTSGADEFPNSVCSKKAKKKNKKSQHGIKSDTEIVIGQTNPE